MSSAEGQVRHRSRLTAPTARLSDLDLRILALLSHHRVLTQNQLHALEPGTPIRTLRYRCARLAREGLAGRTRPYRERGSAPNHLWPTRRGEALACGGPPPRGGGRREPNPLFLAHAAGLSEIFVALETTLTDGITLARFEREGEAREPFTTWPKREKRAIAPDAFIEIKDTNGDGLLAFIELDMGTMSYRRLKQKAAGYAEYAKAEAWNGRHRFCPALLFVTTTEKRARSFLAAMHKEAGRSAPLLTCSSDLARRLPQFVNEQGWLLDADDARGIDLIAALRKARRPYDEERGRQEERRREEDAERERLRTDPEALRSHLRSGDRWGAERLGESFATALRVTMRRDGELQDPERQAFLALAALFADPLHLRLAEREPTADERRAFDHLVDHHRADQMRRIADLAERHGEGPALREVCGRLKSGELLSVSEASWLDQKAAEDRRSRDEQERLASEYIDWREQEARRLAKAQGIAGRLRNRPEDFVAQIDRRCLRVCGRCGEITYPDSSRAGQRAGSRHVASRCHFCGARGALEEIADKEARS